MLSKPLVPRFLVVFAIAVVFSGCATPQFWSYSPKVAPVGPAPLTEKSLAITTFVDARPKVNGDYLSLHWIPLMPFGWQNLETPEEFTAHVHSTQWDFQPTKDLAEAMASELSRSRLFGLVNYTKRPQDYDVVLEGTITSAKFLGFRLSYGLSVAAPALWLFGLPSAHITNRLEMVYVLKDTKSDQTLWSGEYLSEVKGLNGLYYTRPDFYYSEMFSDMATEVVSNLEALIRTATAEDRN